jgi:hypothetical protein
MRSGSRRNIPPRSGSVSQNSRDGAVPLPFLLSRLPLLSVACVLPAGGAREGGDRARGLELAPVRAPVAADLPPGSCSSIRSPRRVAGRARPEPVRRAAETGRNDLARVGAGRAELVAVGPRVEPSGQATPSGAQPYSAHAEAGAGRSKFAPPGRPAPPGSQQSRAEEEDMM